MAGCLLHHVRIYQGGETSNLFQTLYSLASLLSILDPFLLLFMVLYYRLREMIHSLFITNWGDSIMFHKVINSISIEMKMINRNILTYILFIVGVIQLGLIVSGRLDSHSIGGALTSTGAIVQGGLFAFIIFGFFLTRQEAASSSEELFQSISYGVSIKIYAKVITLMIYLALLYCVFIIVIAACYLYYNVPYIFYSQSSLYLLMYYIVPFFISGLLGLTIGTLVQSRLVYPILMILGVMIGPLNVMIFENLMAVFNMNMTGLLYALNLGQADVHQPFDPVYGYQLERERWFQRLTWIVFLALVLYIRVSWKTNKNKMKIAMTSLFVIPFVVLFVFSSINPNLLKDSRYAMFYDHHYYNQIDRGQNQLQQTTHNADWSVSRYDVSMKVDERMFVEAKMKLHSNSASDQIVLSLYHQFKVENIVDENAQNLKFEQINDNITVYYDKPAAANEEKELLITYSGNSSPMFYATNQSILLPYYFRWYPTIGTSPAMMITEQGSLVRLPNQLSNSYDFNLIYIGPTPLYTNLKQNSGNSWSGHTSSGVSLVSGKMMNSTIVNNVKVVYPYALENMMATVPSFIDNLRETRKRIIGDLDLPNPDLPNTIFFVSTPIEDSVNVVKNQWSTDEHIMISISENYASGELLTYDINNIPAILLSLIESPQIAVNSDFADVFAAAYSYWLFISEAKGTDFFFKTTVNIFNHSNHNVSSTALMKLKEFMDNHYSDQALMTDFFKSWLIELHSNQATWENTDLFFRNKIGESYDANIK